MGRLQLSDYAAAISLFDPFEAPPGSLTTAERHATVDRLLEQLEPVLRTLDKMIPAGPGATVAERRNLLHAALNVAPPGSLDAAGQGQLDALLQSELAERTLTDAATIVEGAPLQVSGTKVGVWQGDITTLRIDAIVNAANNRLLGCLEPLHRCIDNAIHSGAGAQLRDDCHVIMGRQGMPEPTGAAKVTRGYNLPAAFVLHTVGPIVSGPLTETHTADLRRAYLSCLELCAELDQIRSVAFCCISTGVFGYPYDAAAETALATVCGWLEDNPGHLEAVVFNVFGDRDRFMYESLLSR